MPRSHYPDFDLISRPYRWLEYLLLGRTLERCRLHFLKQLIDRRRALVLGDGDGRFLAALLAQNGTMIADAVDTSAAMLNLLRARCKRSAPHATPRLRTHHTDALSYLANPSAEVYDLVVTHFFFDCLAQSDLDALAATIAPKLACGAIWLVSEFRIPAGAMSYPAKLLVRSLYLAFRILTGLRVKRLPDYTGSLGRVGLQSVAVHRLLFGILTTEVWSANPEPSRHLGL